MKRTSSSDGKITRTGWGGDEVNTRRVSPNDGGCEDGDDKGDQQAKVKEILLLQAGQMRGHRLL